MVVLLNLSIYIISLILSSNTVLPLSDKGFAEKVLQYHNNYRTKHGSAPLKLDDVLKLKAKRLVKTAAKEEGFHEVTAGESVYEVCATFKVVVTPRQVTKSWYVKIFIFYNCIFNNRNH